MLRMIHLTQIAFRAFLCYDTKDIGDTFDRNFVSEHIIVASGENFRLPDKGTIKF